MKGVDGVLRLFFRKESLFCGKVILQESTAFFEEKAGKKETSMPMLFSLGQHAALVAVAARLREGERLLAFLDDLYIVTSPDRTVEVHNILR